MARQLDLFSPGLSKASEIVCWTRMQAESGEQLRNIIQRKEAERRAGEGQFFWGIGNPLNLRHIDPKASLRIVFSRMVSRPKPEDERPTAVALWRKFSLEGVVYNLPPHVLITSKAFTKTGPKLRHFALVCRSKGELRLQSKKPFDPKAYRNAAGRGRAIGPSQVTAVLRRVSEESSETNYRIDMEAKLVWPFCIQLVDPVLIRPTEERQIAEAAKDLRHWTRFLASLKAA